MTTPAKAGARIWQPLTPRGVAAFGAAPVGRLLLVQSVMAMLAAATVAWFLYVDWCPSIREAIRHLPSRGEIRSGMLDWTGGSPQSLGGGNFLAFAVDLNHGGAARSPADIQVEFGRKDLQIYSLFGYADCGYPKDWIIAFNQTELEPWWGAWKPPLLGIGVGIVSGGLMVVWALMATLYCPAVRLIGFFANRDLDWRASWKIAGAALMPGALLLTVGIVFYGLGVLDLVQLIAAAGAHLVAGWVYVAASPFFWPRPEAAATAKGNPFAPPPEDRTRPARR